MCGFAGFHDPQGLADASSAALVRKMGDRLRHRGPDDAGDWIEPALGTALAFRRLSIIDLTELGHQPMVSPDGRFVLVLNGEIYNFPSLRTLLEQQGRSFRGHSDTEVLLTGISAWGLETTLKRSTGMFAIALIDIRERRLCLARDRLGEKPLYYGWSGGKFFFGSELKAFRPHPAFAATVDRQALTLYTRFGYVPSPWCILEGFHKLPPGQILSLALDGTARSGKERLGSYWSVPKPEDEAAFPDSAEECVGRLEELIRSSIRREMLADVPVGAFLSGGIDSSTVVSLMQEEANIPVKTFSIGFPDPHYDESGHAEAVAKHLGTDHTTWHCTDSELLDLANRIPQVYCEPFADDSQLPTMALARLARQHVTVCLSGDGGDELFHGYGHYEKSLRRWREIQRYHQLRALAHCAVGAGSALVSALADSPAKRRWQSRLRKARNQWFASSLPCYFRHRMSLQKAPDLYLSKPEPVEDFFDATARMPEARENVAWLSYLDLNTYLPDDILVKVDRAAMAFSLETRIPLLDHTIVEYAARIPESLKRLQGRSKWPLRAILERRVPRPLTERPKMGFCTPMGRWLRGPLHDWAEAHLHPDRLKREGFFDPVQVQHLWLKHQKGRRDCGLVLWGILMFQAWHEVF
jgi:asparagine synthase (glutamine-hydrolysing)